MKELYNHVMESIMDKVGFYMFGAKSPEINLHMLVHDDEFVIQAACGKANTTILAKNLIDPATWYEFIVEIGGYVVNHTKDADEAFSAYAALIQYQKEN